jgi:type VI secretion system protein VasG
MSDISRAALFGKLHPVAYKAIESATLFCKLRGNPYVELAHWMHQLLQGAETDLEHILRHFELNPAALARDLTGALDRLPRGASSISDLAVQVEESVERGWVYATLLFNERRVRTGHLVVGWFKTRTLRSVVCSLSSELAKIDVDQLVDRFGEITRGSSEARESSQQERVSALDPSGGASAPALAPAALGKGEGLARFSVDLTERARKGELDRVVGRDEEVRQLIQILMRRRQNNPILAGEAGVGKTAVVEGFAQRIARGDVPPALRGVSLRALDLALLQAGASMKGEFEARLRQVIDEVQLSAAPVILFIDEAHTLIGAGGAQGTGDAANLLKPALARGQLRTIAATTWAEYKKYFENDPALTRRFQVVHVQEPDLEKAVSMLRGTVSAIEAHHRVHLLDEAVAAAVKLSQRLIPERQLPDKAVSLLDTAAARVAVSQHGVPAEVEDSRHRIRALQTEIEITAREQAMGVATGTRIDDAKARLAAEHDRLAGLERRWQCEKGLVESILGIRNRLRGEAGIARESAAGSDNGPGSVAPPPRLDAGDREASLRELERLQAELARMQGETPLISPAVDQHAVAAVVADWTGIPTGRMMKGELETVLGLSEQLGRRVVGQDHALEQLARRIQTARAGLENPDKPIGVFLLAGPSGVGKTETALALAEAMYGGDQNVLTINMSEFQEAHTVSTLKGAPPGYVGYGEGGVLTEAVRRRPHSVVLLDEVEKAHPDVHEVFFQVFDKGWMEDGQGVRVDFKNTILLLTSNVGSDLILKLCAGPERPPVELVKEALRRPLLEVFPAALLGRMVVIPYYPLSDELLGNIVRLQLDRVAARVRERYGVPFDYEPSVIDLISRRCTELESGGRMIDAVLTNTLLPEVSRELLLRTLDGRRIERVGVRAVDGAFRYQFE